MCRRSPNELDHRLIASHLQRPALSGLELLRQLRHKPPFKSSFSPGIFTSVFLNGNGIFPGKWDEQFDRNIFERYADANLFP